jgi:hypothetical protein
MKKNRYVILFFLLPILVLQVKDISFTLSPFAEYTWWDDQSGLKDGTLLGGKLGFGFGEYLSCVRSIYSRQT